MHLPDKYFVTSWLQISLGDFKRGGFVQNVPHQVEKLPVENGGLALGLADVHVIHVLDKVVLADAGIRRLRGNEGDVEPHHRGRNRFAEADDPNVLVLGELDERLVELRQPRRIGLQVSDLRRREEKEPAEKIST